MTILAIIATLLVTILIGCFLLVKWHDKKIKETRERAISAGCPFFTDN